MATKPAEPADGDMVVALLCHRCDRPFKASAIRTLCNACAAGGALPTPECAGV